MSNSKKIKSYSKLFLFVIAIFFMGLISCGKDDGDSKDGWKYVGELKDQEGESISVYIDLNDMLVEGNIRKFWIRYYSKKTSGSGESYIRQVGYWEVDCKDQTLYVLGEEYYGVGGQLLGRNEQRAKESYKEGALGERLASTACRYAGRN